jgi:hypothetical protein
MELFKDKGFEVTDKVKVTIDKQSYYGTVIKIDNDRNRIKVDYTGKLEKTKTIDWFDCKFWTKLETQKHL